jgi:hypothetical protein
VIDDLEERQIVRGQPGIAQARRENPGNVLDETHRLVKVKLGFDPGF